MSIIILKSRKFRSISPVQYLLIGLIIGFFIGSFSIFPLAEVDFTVLRFGTDDLKNLSIIVNNSHSEADHDNATNNEISKELYEKVRILCWIMTSPKTHVSKARHVKNTWGKRCNILLFMSTVEDPDLPTIALKNITENRNNLWGKTKAAFQRVYNEYFDKADWFFKADDDTYAIMENMRYMLNFHNSSLEPIYYGFRFKVHVRQGYMSGGSGYVLSKEALRRFVEESLPDPKKCKNKDNSGYEDAEIGKCLESVGVEAGDSRDEEGRNRFLPLFINSYFHSAGLPRSQRWFYSYSYYPFKMGMDCCSDYLISVHYVSPENMYFLEYLIYHVKPFGISYNSTFHSNDKLNETTLKNKLIIKRNTINENKSTTTLNTLSRKKLRKSDLE